MALVVVGSALALGGAEVHVELVCAFCLVVCGALGFLSGARGRMPWPAVVLAGLGAFSLLQSAPLPLGALQLISPRAAEIWGDALLPFRERLHWGCLSLDPGASTLEAAKWLAYSLAFMLAASFGARRGATRGIALVFASAMLVALATLGHQLVGARRVFGIYAPKFGIAADHVGPILNRNALVGYLTLGALSGFGLVLSTRKPAPRWLCVFGTPVISALIILAGSRGGLAAFLVGLCAFGVLALRRGFSRSRFRRAGWYRRGGVLAVLLVVAAFALFALLGVRDSLRALNHTDMQTLKMSTWVMPLIRDFPLFGVGRGAFESVFPHYKPTADHLDFFYPENIVAQWACEWGAIGVIGLALLLWLCRPAALGFGRQMSASGAILGVGALVLQNLIDFSLELFAPMLALTVVVGCVWGEHRASMRASSRQVPSSRALPAAIVALALVACGLALARGLVPVPTDRLELQAEFEHLPSGSVAARARLWTNLRAAMLRHPAEAYFPRLGALLALRGADVEPLPWITAALNRWEGDSRAHWILARVLQRHGLLPQALLEARLAVENDPDLAAIVGGSVARWSARLDDIERAAPPGPPGAQVRYYAANALDITKYSELRARLLGDAVAEAPRFAAAQWALADELLRRAASGVEPELARSVLARARALDEIKPESADGSMIRLRLYALTEQREEAVRALSERCPSLEQAERVRCWWGLLSTAVARQWGAAPAEVAAQHYVKAACSSEDTCGLALSQAGDAMGSVGDWDLALAFFERAVAREAAVPTLLRLANAATMLERFPVALRALSMAAGRVGSNVSLAAQIEAQKEAILRQAVLR